MARTVLRRRARALLLAALALAVLPGFGCGNCAAQCIGAFTVTFDPPLAAEGRWTFQVTGADAGEGWAPCTVELPTGATDCDRSGYERGVLTADVRDGEIHSVRLPEVAPSLVRISIDHDDEPAFALTLQPAYDASKLCGQTCYAASVSVSF